MKICLVTAFPPSHERINEYGFHLARELQQNPFLSVTVLADEHDGKREELVDFDVVRCWKPNCLKNPLKLLRAIREIGPDVVWFNLVFSSFGVNPIAAFLGLCTPLLVRLCGYSTHITLHHLMENVSLADSGVRAPHLYRLAGWIATHVLLRANSVTVLLPAYRRTLLKKYHRQNVHFRAHGVFSASPQFPDFSRCESPQRILAFGKWGTYKRLELLLEAFPQVLQAAPDCKLVIAGEDHPTTPGYVASLRERYKDWPNIEITGYVPEERIAKLFSTATLMVMPYSSAGGSSGVAHQASQFGLPIICADIPDFREMALEEGLAIEFYRIGDRNGLARAIISLLHDAERRHEMAEQNYTAAVRLTMPLIVRQYVRSFDWQLRRRNLQQVWRYRVPRRLNFPTDTAPAWAQNPLTLPLMPVAAIASAAATLTIPEPAAEMVSPACPTLPAQAPQIYNIAQHRRRSRRGRNGRKAA